MTELEALLRETAIANLDWDTQRIWKALALAQRLNIFIALLDRQPVPKSALDFKWMRRLGI